MTNYKFKIQFDLNMPYVDAPTARSKATALLAAIQTLIEKNCNTPRPTVEKVSLINQDRRDGFNILNVENQKIRGDEVVDRI